MDYYIHIADKTILDYYLPKLCIQPIVENAVVHGLENKMDNGIVKINIRKDFNSIFFEIIDNGSGFETDNISLDSTESVVNRKKGHNNIGLNNTHKRIKLMYGEEYGITIDSTPDMGSKVIVHIPMDREECSHV